MGEGGRLWTLWAFAQMSEATPTAIHRSVSVRCVAETPVMMPCRPSNDAMSPRAAVLGCSGGGSPL